MIKLSLLFIGLAILIYKNVHTNDYELEFFKNVIASVLGISGVAFFLFGLFNPAY